MREPSLKMSTAFSFAIHMTVLLIAFLFLKQSNNLIIIPSLYTVSLISPEVLKGTEAGENIGRLETARNTFVMEDVLKQAIKITKKDEKMVEERISAIAAKKKIEQIVRLRSIISLKASGDDRKSNSKATTLPIGEGTLFDAYYSKIRDEIRQQWVFPDTGQKDLETIISIRIMKDGIVNIQKIEKSSGNPLFDSSAIKAVTKASPLSSPPYEMEIGVRFYP